MPSKKGSKVDRGYATISEDDGVNYRDIARSMTNMGFTMNHSSARNYTLRVMKKLAEALMDEWDLQEEEISSDEIAKSPLFQSGISDILKNVNFEKNLAP